MRMAVPTAERLRHAGGDYELGDDQQGSIVTRMRDSPLERALARRAINREQYSAGVKYRHHWYRAGLAGNVGSADLARIFAAASPDPAGERIQHHRDQYRRASQALGLLLSRVLDMAVCQERPLHEVGSMLGWPARAGAIVVATVRLRDALDVLRRLWGI